MDRGDEGGGAIVCDRCGFEIFRPVSGPPGMVMIAESKNFPCPKCGHITADQAGVFVIVERLFERIASVAPSKAELEALIRALKAAPSAQAANEIVSEEAPNLAPFLTDYWGLDPAKWAEFLPLALFALGYVLAFAGATAAGDAMKAFGGISAALRAAFGTSTPQIDIETAAQRGAEAALESQERRRRERNRKSATAEAVVDRPDGLSARHAVSDT